MSSPAKFGIMQGRLSPPEDGRFQSFPRNSWREEFSRTVDAGLDYIEWIFDGYGASVNPLGTQAGIVELNALKQQHQIDTPAVCADWFMEFPFLRCTAAVREAREEVLHRLVLLAAQIGATRLVIPIVDNSRIQTEADKDLILEVMDRALPVSERAGVELHLETDLNASDFYALLKHIPHPLLKVNYDSGNSSGLGYDVREEFAAYGNRIGSIHIKDRLRDSSGRISTQPLGRGSANFEHLFECIRQIGYTGGVTMQVARGESGDEVNWIRSQLSFIKRYWQ